MLGIAYYSAYQDTLEWSTETLGNPHLIISQWKWVLCGPQWTYFTQRVSRVSYPHFYVYQKIKESEFIFKKKTVSSRLYISYHLGSLQTRLQKQMHKLFVSHLIQKFDLLVSIFLMLFILLRYVGSFPLLQVFADFNLLSHSSTTFSH